MEISNYGLLGFGLRWTYHTRCLVALAQSLLLGWVHLWHHAIQWLEEVWTAVLGYSHVKFDLM